MNANALGRAQAGGLVRVRFSRLELAGFAETSDRDFTGNHWTMVGGSVGAFLSFDNWVDVDVSTGLGARTYENDDLRYGAAGVHSVVPSLVFRLGISERLADGLVAPRFGAALVTGIDLAGETVRWKYQIRDVILTQGATRFQATSVGVLLNFGFDLAIWTQ